MKKHLLVPLFLLVSFSFINAQEILNYPIISLPSSYGVYTDKTMMIDDSILYITNHRGLEKINLDDYSISYIWKEFYPVKGIIADTGNTYVCRSDNHKVLKYNYNTSLYENIWTGIVENKTVTDIEVAQDGKVWAVTANISKDVAIYNGDEWEVFPYPGYIYYGFRGIKLVNDSLAYLLAGNTFYSFHNGVFDTLFTNYGPTINHWDVDNDGNLWAARGEDLIYIFNDNITIYDTTNCPIGTDDFKIVEIGSNGHVWTCGNSNKLLEFDGTTWQVHSLPSLYAEIENFTLDSQNKPWIVFYNYQGRQLCTPNGDDWTINHILFMPLTNVKAIGLKTGYNNYGYFANDQGFFIIHMNSFSIHSFWSPSSTYPFTDDITCFADYSITPAVIPVYGTNSGVGGIQDFDNDQLPSLHVNHITYKDGTYYIATDNGLVAYNGILYTQINTSNSPLPSDEITFVTTDNDWYAESGGLYIATDKGVAIYKNAQWFVYDSTNIPLNNASVSGVLPSPYDDGTYISTLGNGLIKVFPNGDYEVFNTTNENLLDDTLFYVRHMPLMMGRDYVVYRYNHHRDAYTNSWSQNYFNYDTFIL